jgi:glycosyltransferase involved in cell wall biosynthesis
VSSSLSAYGGIATFVRNMRETELWNEWQVHHIATHCDGTKFARLRVFLTGFFQVLREIVWRRPAVAHLHASERGSFVRKGILTWTLALFRVPVVMQMHGGNFQDFYDDASGRGKRLIRATLERTDVVIAIGGIWAQRFQDVAPGAYVEVIPNAIRPMLAVDQATSDHVRVVFLGKLCDEKGTDVLLDAWAQVRARKDTRPATITLAGWGELDRFKEQAKHLGIDDSVQITGWLSREEAQDLLASSHVLVLPSLYECQPMSILEAMARGMCVVSTPVGGIPEMIGESDGILVSPGRTDELAEALACVINDGELRQRLGTHARKRVEEQFNVDVIARRFDDLYRRVACGSAARGGSATDE